MQATTNDSIYGYRVHNAYYRTLLWNFSTSKNDGDSSANFEVIIDYFPSHAVATFTAMNKNATNYTFYVKGFRSPILLYGKSVSFDYSYISNRKVQPRMVHLIIEDSLNNCSDTVRQQILIRNPFYTIPVDCAIYSDPYPKQL